MKKITLTLLFAGATYLSNSQTYWPRYGSAEIDPNEKAKLGSSNNRSLNFLTHDTTRVLIDSLGHFIVPGFANDGSFGDKFLLVDENGAFKTTNWGTADACTPGSSPWFMGGNFLNSGASSLAGTCNEADFILEAYNKPLIYLKTNKMVGIGPYNSSPSAQLDVADGSMFGSSAAHLRIYGNADGIIESNANMALYYSSLGEFNIWEGNPTSGPATSRFIIQGGGNGNVGIGTQTPGTKLTVESGSYDGFQSRMSSSTAKALAVYNTGASATNFAVLGSGQTNIGYQSYATNAAMLNVNVAGSSGSPVNALDVFDQYTGNVNFRVKSNGDVFARYVKVTVNSFPDYVFERNYKLPNLRDIEAYYLKNKHLPEIPAAAQVEKEGLDLGEMSKLLLKKIEELTIIAVEQDKRAEELSSTVDKLKLELEKIKQKNGVR